MNRSTTHCGSRVVVALVAAAAATLVGADPAAAAARQAAGSAGCAPTVQLQPMSFPTSTGQHRSASALMPDEGGALAPTATVVERRTADSDELDLMIGTGADAVVRPIYLAPDDCVIAWSNDVHPISAPEGRRSVHTPAFTVRLIALIAPDRAGCMRPV